MDKDTLERIINEYADSRKLMESVNSNINEFIEAYKEVSNKLNKLQRPDDIELKEKIDGLEKKLGTIDESIKEYKEILDNNINVATKINKSIINSDNAIKQINEKLTPTLELITNTLGAMNNFNTIVESFSQVDFSSLEKNIPEYTSQIVSLNKNVKKNIADKIKTNDIAFEKLHKSVSKVVDNSDNQTNTLGDISTKLLDTNMLLEEIVTKGNVDEQMIYEILDKWAESRNIKIKKVSTKEVIDNDK